MVKGFPTTRGFLILIFHNEFDQFSGTFAVHVFKSRGIGPDDPVFIDQKMGRCSADAVFPGNVPFFVQENRKVDLGFFCKFFYLFFAFLDINPQDYKIFVLESF